MLHLSSRETHYLSPPLKVNRIYDSQLVRLVRYPFITNYRKSYE